MPKQLEHAGQSHRRKQRQALPHNRNYAGDRETDCLPVVCSYAGKHFDCDDAATMDNHGFGHRYDAGDYCIHLFAV